MNFMNAAKCNGLFSLSPLAYSLNVPRSAVAVLGEELVSQPLLVKQELRPRVYESMRMIQQATSTFASAILSV